FLTKLPILFISPILGKSHNKTTTVTIKPNVTKAEIEAQLKNSSLKNVLMLTSMEAKYNDDNLLCYFMFSYPSSQYSFET
ncbi:hypothetical protein, partial [Runella sp.]